MRVSAINAVAMLGRGEYLPHIRAIIDSAKSNDSAKLSSIASLAYLAEDQDVATLETIASSNTKFRYAAKSALKKLSQ